VRRAISASSPCPSRSVGDLCRRGTPSPLTPPKTTLLTRVLARSRRIIRAREHTKIRIRKFILKALQPFIRKFCTVQNFPLYGIFSNPPKYLLAKISGHTVCIGPPARQCCLSPGDFWVTPILCNYTVFSYSRPYNFLEL